MIRQFLVLPGIAMLAAGAMMSPIPTGRFQEWMQQHRHEVQQRQQDATIARLPAGIRVLRDVPYGKDPLERFDVYAPEHAQDAPVILMVHGGAWFFGDKSGRGVVENKVARWVPRGCIVVSVDYPMVPDADPLQQAQAVARALAVAQREAPQWGGDPRRFVLMGHSAGAHLVALLGAEPALATAQGAQPWLGTVALDSAAYDVAQIMRGPHDGFYDRAFGKDPAFWTATSPTQQLHARIAPFLAVCSTRRRDSCPAAEVFVDKAKSFGTAASVLREDLSHAQINEELGLPSHYSAQVDDFMASLDPDLARRLAGH